MKYRISLLADHASIKTVCITSMSEADEPGRLSTRLMRYFDKNPASNRDELITVVIKGQELTQPFVQALVSRFFSHSGLKPAHVLEMDD